MLKVLIVEDEFYTLNAIEKIVLDSGLGCQVTGKAYDGEEALELIEEEVPDLVLTDIKMPNMDGLELARRLAEEYPQITVVMISGYSDFSYAQKGIRYRVFDYLLKPLKREQLVQVIRRVLDQESSGHVSLKETWNPKVMEAFQNLVKVIRLLEQEKAQAVLEELWQRLVIDQHLDQRAEEEVGEALLVTLHSYFPDQEKLSLRVPQVQETKAESVFQWVLNQIQQLMEAIDESRQSLGSDILKRVLDYVEENFGQDIGLNDVADIAFLNPSYFSEKFKELTGENFSTYLTRVRMEKAKELLQDGRYKVYEVAQRVGYTDQAYFSRVFKKRVGYNPAEYRRRMGV